MSHYNASAPNLQGALFAEQSIVEQKHRMRYVASLATR